MPVRQADRSNPSQSLARLAGYLLLALALLPARSWPAGQNLHLRLPPAPEDAATAAIMRDLAERALPVYQDADRERYLTNLSALQLAAGNYTAAYATRQALRESRRAADVVQPIERSPVYDLYARARLMQAKERMPFAQAFTQSFRELLPQLADAQAYAIISRLEIPPETSQRALQRSLDRWRGKGVIELADAVQLIWEYLAFEAYRSFGPLIGTLAAEDDARRYITDNDVVITTPEGERLTAVLVRPRNAAKPLPTLLEFTIYVYPVNDARECAAHGYVGVVAFARGKRKSPDQAVPFQYDGLDARGVIGWISRQPWSDGRVGMYGTDYSGFAAWAAAKHLPRALKAIATSAPMAPGIDVPKGGNIYRNSAYRWVRYVTDNKGLDTKIEEEGGRWRALDEAWYRSGRSYWDLMHVYGRPNANFRRWLGHPSYDGYWQQMIPFQADFAAIDIPVLTTTGYFDGAAASALYYFTQHYRYDPHAEHTLLIGPYDHEAAQRGPLADLHGYSVDPAALIDIRELRYQWFDSVLKGAARPALLADRVNYELMGANEWRHAPSLDAMANDSLKLYLDAGAGSGGGGDDHRLLARQRSDTTFVQQIVPFADRRDADWRAPTALRRSAAASHYSIAYVSDPLPQPMEVSGLLTGRLDLRPNRMDLDITLTLYERLASGEYLQLFDPPGELRASYARDRVHRHLLRAGERQQLAFSSERMTSRRLQAGSRLVMVLGVNKRPDQQLDYGSGKDVSDESIEDARTALKIRWYSSSYIELPLRR